MERKKEILALLRQAGLLFDYDDSDREDPDWDPEKDQSLNLNDAIYYACADAEVIPDDQLREVERLFVEYGRAGVLYWVCDKRRPTETPEFERVKRAVEFVRREEELRAADQARRGYAENNVHVYLITGAPLPASEPAELVPMSREQAANWMALMESLAHSQEPELLHFDRKQLTLVGEMKALRLRSNEIFKIISTNSTEALRRFPEEE